MTTIVAVVGGPLLIALVDLIRRRNARVERNNHGFPVLPVTATPGGRPLVNDLLLAEPVVPAAAAVEIAEFAEVAEVAAAPCIEEKIMSSPIPDPTPDAASNPEPCQPGVDGLARIPRIAAPTLPMAKPLPSERPRARFLAYPGPRGFQVQPR